MVNALIRTVTLPLRFVLGFDAFISYSRADATDHAEALANELAHRHLRPRIDMQEATPGERVTFYMRVSVILSKVLVVLCTPGSITSPHVKDEIEIFQKWSAGPIVLVEISAPPERALWWPFVRGLARVKWEEVRSSLTSIASRIVNSVGYWRVTRAQSMVSALFVLLLLTSAYFYYRVDSLRRTAEQGLNVAKVQTSLETDEAQKQGVIAAQNVLKAQKAEAKAAQATKDAESANEEAASASKLKNRNISAALVLHSRAVAPIDSRQGDPGALLDSLPQMAHLARLSARDPAAYYAHLYVEALNRADNSEALSALAAEAPLMGTLETTIRFPTTVHVLKPEKDSFRVLCSDGSSYWVRPGSRGWASQQERGAQLELPEWVTPAVELQAAPPSSYSGLSSRRLLSTRAELDPTVERATPDGNLVASPGEQSGVKLPAFTDLKLHNITGGSQDPNSEPLDQNSPAGSEAFFAGNQQFITRKLWGVGNSGPYMHHGKLTTMREAILAHSGEALQSRVASQKLSDQDRDCVIEFLKSLQILPQGTKSMAVDENGHRTATLGYGPS